MTSGYRIIRHSDGAATVVTRDGLVHARLEALFCRLQAQSTYYRAQIAATGIGSDDPIALLGALPETNKAIYRTTLVPETLAALGDASFVTDFSSGSSSRPVLRFCRMADDLSEQETTEQAFRRAGIREGDRLVLMDVGAAQIHDFYARAARNLGAIDITYLHLTRDLDAALGALGRLRPSVLLTIPTLLVRAASQFDRFWPRSGCPLRCLISTGEAMPTSLRLAAKQAWFCRVMSLYGTTETGVVASECVCEDGHHVDVAAHVLTVRAPHWIDAYTVEGELLITTPHVYTHSVVKYAVGDVVRISVRSCGCGEPTPRLWHLGREQEEFVFAGEKFAYSMILGALQKAVSDLHALTLEIEDVAAGHEQVVMRAILPEAFRPRAHELLAVLREGIFEIDSLVRFGLVRLEIDFRPPSEEAGRKRRHVIDKRRFFAEMPNRSPILQL